MRITSDWHIHSIHSHDSAAMPVSLFAGELGRKGIHDYGLTDHLHTLHNLPDIVASRNAFLSSRPSCHFHFGIEASCVSQWEIEEIARGTHENPVWGVRNGGPENGALAIGLTEQNGGLNM